MGFSCMPDISLIIYLNHSHIPMTFSFIHWHWPLCYPWPYLRRSWSPGAWTWRWGCSSPTFRTESPQWSQTWEKVFKLLKASTLHVCIESHWPKPFYSKFFFSWNLFLFSAFFLSLPYCLLIWSFFWWMFLSSLTLFMGLFFRRWSVFFFHLLSFLHHLRCLFHISTRMSVRKSFSLFTCRWRSSWILRDASWTPGCASDILKYWKLI